MTEIKNTEVRARSVQAQSAAAKVIEWDHMTDEELMAEYRLAGSPQVFETLVRRYERELYNYLRRFLGNTVLAEDAFQATFMQVHLKCHLFDGERKVRPWLYTVATNQAIDIQRRNRRHRLVSLDRVSRAEHQELGTLVNLLRSREEDPGDQMEQGERKDWVREAVAALPEQLRTAVGLVYFKGMKYREAADELDVPVGTVKSRIHSAVKRLTEAWELTQAGGTARPNNDFGRRIWAENVVGSTFRNIMEACQLWQASLLDTIVFIGQTAMRELLVRYLLGELNSQETEQLEAQLRDSPELRRELEYLQACMGGDEEEGVEHPVSAEAPRGLAERTLGRVCSDEPCDKISHTPAEVAAAYDPPQGTPSWSLADLTVAGGVCLAISMLFLPALRQSRDAARRTGCENNLRELGTMLVRFSDDHGNFFPTPTRNQNAGIFTPYLLDGEYAHRDELVRLLLCRASPMADQTGKDRIVIRVPTMCEFEAAIAKQRCMMKRAMSPYFAYLLGFVEGDRHCAVRNTHSCRKAVLADAPCDKLGNMSANHGEGGANVMYQDGHVKFQKQLDLAAAQRGEIYLNDAGQAAAGLDRDDTVLGRSEATPGKVVPISRSNR